ncbi:MAG: DUF1579 family protein [Gammaproteobacteria bacterium]
MTDDRAAEPALTKYGQRNARAPQELGAFSFLVGKWKGTGKVKLPDGTTAEFAVSWIGRYVLDGMAILDEFHSSQPDGSPYLGLSLRQYDASRKNWIVEYVNVSHSFLRRQVNATSGSVGVEGPVVVIISQAPDTWSRETYTVGPEDHFTYRIDMSNDGGVSWNVGQIEMSFTRHE